MLPQWYELPEAQRAARTGDRGTILRLARTARGLTQAQAGALVHWSGTTMSRHETGVLKLTDLALLRQLSVTFAIPPRMFGLTEAASDQESDPAGIVRAQTATGGHRVQRRNMLGGLAAIAGIVLLPVAALADQGITAGLDKLLLGHDRTSAEPVTIERVTAMLAAAHRDFRACHYQQLTARLPDLLRVAAATRDAQPHDQRAAAESLLSDGYALATDVLVKLHENGAAWATADRAIQAATAADDPRALARAQRLAAIVLRRSAHSESAQDIVLASARRFTIATGLTEPGDASFLAAMLCTASYTAALTDRRAAAYDLLDESKQAVLEHGRGGFGNNDITLYGIGVARAVGDFGQAVDYSQQVRLDLLGSPERHARYWEDTALAWWGRANAANTFHAMLRAEQAAPQEVRYRPWAQTLTKELLSSGGIVGLGGLRSFAARVGVL